LVYKYKENDFKTSNRELEGEEEEEEEEEQKIRIQNNKTFNLSNEFGYERISIVIYFFIYLIIFEIPAPC
jgi:hypothetical protein